MKALVAGIVSFLIAYLFDWASIKRIPYSKQVIAFLAVGLHLYALYAACWGVSRFSAPVALSALGWFMLPISIFLLCYSWFLELPSGKTFVKAGVGDRLVTTGTWALTRHPGVLWYLLALISLLLATRSTVLLYAAPVWLFMDVLHVVIQERFFFPRMFPDYPRYREQTPMLIPTRASIAACLRTLRAKEALR